MKSDIEQASGGGGRIRLAKYMAMAAVASRRGCEDLIREGRVTVNGQAVLTPASTVDPEADAVALDGRLLARGRRVYLMLNKPAGYTCSARDVHAGRLVYELLPKRLGRVFSVGRLDRDSEGLLILTSDGDFAQRICHPSRRVEKCYLVDCEGCFSGEQRRRMLAGVEDEGELLKPLAVRERRYLRSHTEIEVVLQEGRKREVRRLCRAVGLQVNRLVRVRYGCLELGALPTGSWRPLAAAEIAALQKTPPRDGEEPKAPPAREGRPAREARGGRRPGA